jgi:hypothetical protein
MPNLGKVVTRKGMRPLATKRVARLMNATKMKQLILSILDKQHCRRFMELGVLSGAQSGPRLHS